eukprot:scaffold1704_cov246-Pinguiococcus_pyrenoidosus.AAC.2
MALRRLRRRLSWSFIRDSISFLRSTRYAFFRSRVFRACSRFFARRYSSASPGLCCAIAALPTIA